jgi:hypothetical protein
VAAAGEATVGAGMGTAAVTRGPRVGEYATAAIPRRIATGNDRGGRNAQPATGHSPSSDVVSMMRPSATQAAP